MKPLIFSLLCLIGFSKVAHAQADLANAITNKYWRYDHSAFDTSQQNVYVFVRVANADSIRKSGTGIYLEVDGTFREVIKKNTSTRQHGCVGVWTLGDNVVGIICDGKKWNYKIIAINDKEMSCFIYQ